MIFFSYKLVGTSFTLIYTGVTNAQCDPDTVTPYIGQWYCSLQSGGIGIFNPTTLTFSSLPNALKPFTQANQFTVIGSDLWFSALNSNSERTM